MHRPLALILGAGPLLGLSVARRFAREGYRLALVGADEPWLHEAVAGLPDARGYLQPLQEPGGARATIQAIQAEWGDAEVLVCHASSGLRGGAMALELGALMSGLQVDLLAPLEAIQAVLPAMRAAGRGTILFTGGGLALKPQADMAAASIGKGAARQLALCLHEELAPEGIHVALVTVAGFIQRGTAMDPDRLAETYWALHTKDRKDWRCEVVLRASMG